MIRRTSEIVATAQGNFVFTAVKAESDSLTEGRIVRVTCAGGRVIGRVGGEESQKPQHYWASDRVKRRLDTVGVCGSNPHAPTNAFNRLILTVPHFRCFKTPHLADRDKARCLSLQDLVMVYIDGVVHMTGVSC